MDENEARLAAIEGLLMEMLALQRPEMIALLRVAVQSWPRGRQRAQALMILQDAEQRYDEFSVGQVLKR